MKKEVEGQEQLAEAVPDSSGASTAAQSAVGKLVAVRLSHLPYNKWYWQDAEGTVKKEVEGQEQPAEAVPDSSGPSTAAQTAVGEVL